MQNKGAIRLFAIVLALVCVYQLSFTFFSQKTERDAEKYAQGDPVKEKNYLDSISGEVVYNFVWLRKYTYMECKEREINLGLDLKGGMNVVLEISVEDVIRSLAAPHYLADPVFTKTMALAHQKRATAQEDFVVLFAQSFQEVSPGGKLAQFFMTPDTRGQIDLTTTNEEVISYLRKQAESAIDNSFNVLRNRIDRFGVVQPNIQRLERQGRILVELPGIKDPERVTKLLTGTANLEFWTTYENSEVLPYFQEANTLLKEIVDEEGGDVSILGAAPVNAEAKPEEAKSSEISLLDTPADSTGEINLLQQDSASQLSSQQEEMRKENPLFSVLIPYLDDKNQPVGGSVVGIANVRDTAVIDGILQRQQVKALFPSDMQFYWHQKPMKENESFIQLHALKASREKGATMSGKYVTEATMQFGQFKNEAQVHMSMNGEGAKRWANLTRENVGRCIAIVLDGYVVSAPVVRGEIKGGSSSIEGNFTQAEATDLANILKSGKMPARARIESSEVIGPSLGQSSIQSGLNSFIISFVVVLLYMLFWYSRSGGLVADIALTVNMFFLFGVLASLQAVLTLPGIAGIALTIGMAVDANVLIFERIKEELAAGKGVKIAIADGYKNAYSAIIDSNVTTILTGVILYVFGTGPIKGFATTLVIGILTSLFSGIFITRLIYERLLAKNRKLTFSTRLTEKAFRNVNIDFLGMRKYFYVISGIIIIAGAIGLYSRGLSLGVDFTGGRNIVVEFKNDVNTLAIREALKPEFEQAPSVITFGQKSTVRITTKYLIDDERPSVDSIIKAKLYDGLTTNGFVDPNAISKTDFIETDQYIKSALKVGPAIATDIKVQAIWAILLSLVMIFLYILVRFRNWQFGLGALTSLAHDVAVLIGIFALFHGVLPFSMEIDQSFIAAILTVVGYSINDTVVVYDRIREYRTLFRKRGDYETINRAMNSTLSRTFSTSFSTLIVIGALFIFGGEVIRGFVFALLIGIGVGTYSSVFIATPVVFDTIRRRIAEKDETK
ncbi:MAG: protein translocase subunit SecDF [Bacteroidales bacterium]|nr:protein translocase subunit SecDF [Bacteroidales bacterium]MCB9013554.1 protein translocase subunit SecDF [Bacteroidales bacterium]